MINLNWQKSRLVVLATYSGAMAIALLLVLTKPNQNPFPKSAVWDDWKAIETDRLSYYDRLFPGRKYQPSLDKDNLDIEIYMIADSRGETLNLMNQYWQTQLKPSDIVVKSDSEIGSYGFLNKGDRTYLNTCIHTDGKTAFTPAEFSQLANANLKSRLVPWIFGLSDLRDWDCFWVNMSIPSNNRTIDDAGILLEQKLLALLKEAKFE